MVLRCFKTPEQPEARTGDINSIAKRTFENFNQIHPLSAVFGKRLPLQGAFGKSLLHELFLEYDKD
jgi:hypothetical protein